MAAAKVKVMQITHDLKIGGLQRVVVDLALNLDKRRYSVSVCALKGGGPFEEELLRHGISVFKLPVIPNQADYFGFWKLSRILNRERPDLIHTHNTHPLIDGVAAAILAGVPARIHTDHARQFPDKKRYMIAERILSARINQMVAVSEAAKESLYSHEGIRPDRIKVVLNGIDGEKYYGKVSCAEKRKEMKIEAGDGPVLGFVGRLSPEKGLIYLIEAMERLAEEFPKVLLLIAGDGELIEELSIEVRRRSLARNVRFLGPRLDVNEVMSVFDIFVLPSLREGLPLVLLEAMAASLPIVATDVGGNRTAVVEGVNGLIVPSKEIDLLHHALRRLILSEDLRREFSQNSLRLFRGQFSIEKMIKEYEAIYEDCLKDGGR